MADEKTLPTLTGIGLLEATVASVTDIGDYTHNWVGISMSGTITRFVGKVNSGRVCTRHNSMYSLAVRPALHFNSAGDYAVGDLFKFGGKWFKVVNESTAFCVFDLGFYEYSEERGEVWYEHSVIKRFLDRWYESALNGVVSKAKCYLKEFK